MEIVKIKGKVFQHIKTRAYTPISVYKGEGLILRKGQKDLIEPELQTHKSLLGYGFPVPKIVEEDKLDTEYYYLEESLGDTLLGDLFWEDYKNNEEISDKNFEILLKISKQFASAQPKTISGERDEESFYLGAHVDYILDELPHLKDRILKAFRMTNERTSVFPYVLTHGDLNAYNLFEEGIIDFGSIFHAPAGYDLIGNIYHTYNFPKGGDYESMRRYEFTEQQISKYMSEMDKIYMANNLPKVSDHSVDFMFPKLIWSVVRMERYPKLQHWRYKRFEEALTRYLEGDNFLNSMLLNN